MAGNWLSSVFSHPTLAGSAFIAGKTAVVYIFLVAGLRLMGKRELGQMNTYDLVLIIVLANAVQNAMVGSDNSLIGGMVAATTLLIMNRLFTHVMDCSDRVEHFMVGEPAIILNDGELLVDRMRREGITRAQVMAALREHGLEKTGDAHLCILEVDGTISVVPRDSAVHRTKRHFRAFRMP